MSPTTISLLAKLNGTVQRALGKALMVKQVLQPDPLLWIFDNMWKMMEQYLWGVQWPTYRITMQLRFVMPAGPCRI